MKERFNRVHKLLMGKELGILPGNLAYSFFLAIIPIVTLLFYFITSIDLRIDFIQSFLADTLPQSVVKYVKPVLTDEMSLTTFFTLWLSIVVMVSGCNSIIITSNTIYNFENASFFRRLVKSLLLSIILIGLIAFLLIVPLLGRSIINLIGHFTNFIENNQQFIDNLYTILQIPVSLLVMFYIIKLIYYIAPDDSVPSKYMNKGALLTTVGWLLVTVLYSYYINNIARYDLVYGNLANIVILLFWFYVLAYIFVLGLYINKNSAEAGIEKTNTIKLEEIRKRIKEDKKRK